MKIHVGSQNEQKVAGVREVLVEYPCMCPVEISGVAVDSGVSDQPKSLDETIQGAMNRARLAFASADYGIGVEGGLAEVPHTKTGYMNITACAIYDGEHFHIGLSSGFEYPPDAIDLVMNEGLDIEQAFYKLRYTDNPKIGSAEGAIGLLTHKRVSRREYIKPAIQNAMIHIEHADKYIKNNHA